MVNLQNVELSLMFRSSQNPESRNSKHLMFGTRRNSDLDTNSEHMQKLRTSNLPNISFRNREFDRLKINGSRFIFYGYWVLLMTDDRSHKANFEVDEIVRELCDYKRRYMIMIVGSYF